MSETLETPGPHWDCVVVLGGGLNQNGLPHDFVQSRLRAAASLKDNTEVIVLLSRGTTHKSPPINTAGCFVLDESVAMADWLQRNENIPASMLITENWSLDTIGNAFFLRTSICEPFGWRKIAVVTSDFHMPRAKAIFTSVFSLLPIRDELFRCDFFSIPMESMDQKPWWEQRVAKEHLSLQSFLKLSSAWQNLSEAAEFVFRKHDAYRVLDVAEREDKAQRDIDDVMEDCY
jgi:hypothetical protein